MENLVLAIHLILALLLVGAILIQRSEGGALGMGGGGGGAVMSGRGAATFIQKATWGLIAAFVATSITLTIFATDASRRSIVNDSDSLVPLELEGGADFAPGAGPLQDLTPESLRGLTPPASEPAAPASGGLGAPGLTAPSLDGSSLAPPSLDAPAAEDATPAPAATQGGLEGTLGAPSLAPPSLGEQDTLSAPPLVGQ